MNEVEDIKSCWSKIKTTRGADFFVNYFYQLLFENHPETRSLFSEDLTQLKSSLLATLDNVINGIEYIEDIGEELLSLGRHHKNLGIKKEMFDAFILSIVVAANYSTDNSLTDNELTAWESAFRNISNTMLKAY